MRTAKEMVDTKYVCKNMLGTSELWTTEQMIAAMKEYAIEAVDEVFSNLDSYILSVAPDYAEVRKFRKQIENE